MRAMLPGPAAEPTYKTVKARFWPWFQLKSRQNLASCAAFARTRTAQEEQARMNAMLPGPAAEPTRVWEDSFVRE
jgi:hypothetical protein